jgi:hypothetical protein
MVAAKRMSELLELPEDERVEIARTLLASVMDDEAPDEMDEEERQRLHESLDQAEEDSRAGRTRPAHLLLAELRALSSK